MDAKRKSGNEPQDKEVVGKFSGCRYDGGMKVLSLLLLLLLSCTASKNDPGAKPPVPVSSNHEIADFAQAKRLAWKIHEEHPFTLYCGCRYQKKTVDLKSCGYKVHKDARRAARVEWEHVVPAQAFGLSFSEWRAGAALCKKKNKSFKGRKCAEKNPEFSRMEADLYNLWPEVGELNGLRNNFSMASLGGPSRHPAGISFGSCQALIADKKFEPMDKAKGIVARTYLYMDQAYPGRGIISEKNRKLFEAWDRLFPVTDWECRRARKIAALQGNENPILKTRCKN